MESDAVVRRVEQQRGFLTDLSMDLWNRPELGLAEHESSDRLREALRAEGFEVTTDIGGMPTAFVARYGDGGPTVGILGEFDALPGLSQEVAAEQKPIEEGKPGHGCGHNLLGVAGVGAAIALKDAIDDGELDGSVAYYGCPAEETLVGKVFMAREGVFDDLDAALTWHPGRYNSPFMSSTLSLNSVRYEFSGESAHAAASPESGRSALDAVQLCNTGVEYMREHVPDDARIHYSIVDGGDAPNVVPANATVWYFVRAPERETVEDIQTWLDDIAESAATMTRTDVEREFLTGCHGVLPNETIGEVMSERMEGLDAIPYTDDDRAFAADLKESLSRETIDGQLADLPSDVFEEVDSHALYTEPLPAYDAGTTRSGSTDVGDVSRIVPLGQFWGATWPVGTNAHSWQAVAANGSFASKGMVYAAKVLAGTAAELLSDPETLRAVREEFEENGGGGYETPLPESVASPPEPSD
ncbi:amidohydrolase [Haladaptatus sp. CMAA 1911]|uniref:amidohydrolase n=1 Tax=unclassified Haladaptatus TaxID=2622732 RepID=UPI0037544367